jgi:hypothetical protein
MLPQLNRQTLQQIFFWCIAALCAAALILLPGRLAALLFVGMVAASGGVLLWRYWNELPFRDVMNAPERTLAPSLERWLPWQRILEVVIVTLLAVYATRGYLNSDPQQTLPGREVEWQVNTAYVAVNSLKHYGYIPLWNPWLEHGHPLIDNPQSFLLNPFSTYPSLILGGVRGMKLSVVIAALLAGWGGWWLGDVLRLRAPGRVLLGALLIGKGNMMMHFAFGYVQLASSQAYFPWIIAAALVLLRQDEGRAVRRAVIVLAMALTLQFWGGSIWFSLPMLFCLIALTLVYLRRAGETRINTRGLRRLALAGVLSLALGAITVLPIWLQRDYMGAHPSDENAGEAYDFGRVVEQFFDSSRVVYTTQRTPGEALHYYSYVLPIEFALFLLVTLPLHRGAGNGRVWIAAGVLILIHLAWGAGGNPIIQWLYRNLEMLGQWRFVGRALGVVSFWLAVLAAMRLDALWRAVADVPWQEWLRLRSAAVRVLQGGLLLVVLFFAVSAVNSVMKGWEVWGGTVEERGSVDAICLDWLRSQHPNEPLIVYRYRYENLLTYVDHHVRKWPIEADYEALAMASTISSTQVMRTMPEYGIGAVERGRELLRENGYELVLDSPIPEGQRGQCLWRREGVPGYAFSVGAATLRRLDEPLTADQTNPITGLDYAPDQIRLRATASPDDFQIVVLQETAYPGWRAEVNGQRVKLESVGGFIGVILPKGEETYDIEFRYRPPLVLWGAVISILTAVFCAGWLLRAERLFRRFWPTTNPRV